MRIPKIEAPTLSIPARRISASAWIRSAQKGSILHVKEGQEIIGSPGQYDTVVLEYSLNYCKGLEQQRAIIRKAGFLTRSGGRVIAVSRACDSGQELAERMVTMGIEPEKLGVSNITNKEITCLRPKEAVLLVSVATLRLNDEQDDPESASENHRKALEYATRVRRSPIAPDIRGAFPERFSTKIVDIGLTWHQQ